MKAKAAEMKMAPDKLGKRLEQVEEIRKKYADNPAEAIRDQIRSPSGKTNHPADVRVDYEVRRQLGPILRSRQELSAQRLKGVKRQKTEKLTRED